MITEREIKQAYKNLREVVKETPLELSYRLSEKYKAKIFLKREDLQIVRSYKIRGAYNLISSLSPKERRRGVVCASAGNHAQGVALSCKLLKIKGRIFMPKDTPKQKIERVRIFGGKFIELELVGDAFDETNGVARGLAVNEGKIFVPPFDDPRVIAGQGTVAVEIYKQHKDKIDMIVVPIGGGGLISGVGIYARSVNPEVKIIGAEPEGSPSMYNSVKHKKIQTLERIDKFVDGAAVKRPGDLTFAITRKVANKILLVPEGKVCSDMIALYQNDGIIAEPAGTLSVSALDQIAREIRRKTVVCIVSGGNNDISRYPEIIRRSLIYQESEAF